MHKIEVRKPGGYEKLEWLEAPDPSPGPDEVLVNVVAAGVNYADCIVRMGLYESAKAYVGWPITPGFEFAGHVARLGAGADGLQLGDTVFGVCRFGGYATQVVVPRSQLFVVPEGMQPAAAAGVPAVFLTAWYALSELSRLRPKMKVLVHSAAGGVGLAAVQIARAFDCEPIGIVGADHKLNVALEYGASQVFSKHDKDLWRRVREAAPDGYAAVLDPNGADTLRKSYDALGPMGRLIVYGFSSMLPMGRGKPSYARLVAKYLKTPRFNPIEMTGDNKSVMAFNLSYLFEHQELLTEAMAQMLELFAAGRLRPLGFQSFSLSEAGQAHRLLESGQTTGKLVLLAK